MRRLALVSLLASILLTLITSHLFEVDFIKRRRKISARDIQNVRLFHEGYPLLRTINDQMLVNIGLGNPAQSFNVLLDTGSFYLWVVDKYSEAVSGIINKYDHKASSTFVNVTEYYSLLYVTGTAAGYMSREKLTLGGFMLEDFNFILADEVMDQNDIDGIMGMGYYYEDIERQNVIHFSLLDQLKKNGHISRRLFTQKFTGESQGKMFIGDMPEEIQTDLANYGTCDALEYNDQGILNPLWQCVLKGVFVGYDNVKDAIKMNESTIFDTGTNVILAPLSFAKYLLNNYFKKFIENGECLMVNNEDVVFVFVCSSFINLNKFEDINFIFGDWVLKMRPRDLFRDDVLYKEFTILCADLDIWIMGEPLLKKYHMVFDKDSKKIGFYGTEDKHRKDLPFPKSYPGYLIIICVIAIILSILFIIFGIVLIIRTCKRRNINLVDDISKPGPLDAKSNNNPLLP